MDGIVIFLCNCLYLVALRIGLRMHLSEKPSEGYRGKTGSIQWINGYILAMRPGPSGKNKKDAAVARVNEPHDHVKYGSRLFVPFYQKIN